MRTAIIRFALLAGLVIAAGARADDREALNSVPAQIQPLIQSHCIRCHGEKKQKGQVRLDTFAELGEGLRLDLLARVSEQLHLEQMPPEDEKQPTEEERKLLADWIGGEQQKHNVPSLEDKIRYPDYGNWVDHGKLFSGEIKDKAFSPARRWLVSPQIFQERVLDLFKLDARERSLNKRGFYGLSNPFTLPDHSGVRYYDITALDGGNLFAMLNNAAWISGKQILAARFNSGELQAGAFENKLDRWYPKQTPAAFEKIILQKSLPTDEELSAAIQTQFDCVLQRPANEVELKKYLNLTRGAIKLVGNSEGLRQMLSAVLLESEFVYRMEFGTGRPDEYGRRTLAPRAASYAIAYAIGDRGPDAALAAAAREGRLISRSDYEREVKRLLADANYNKGNVDVSLNNKHWDSLVTSHPRIIRFFREYFGYPLALKVFKDNLRSGGYYQNPDRGSPQTPGVLVNEADMLVDLYVRQDSHVFENLLAGDSFFVAPVENAGAKIDMLNELFERFKSTQWMPSPSLKAVGRRNTKADTAPKLSVEDLVFVRQRLGFRADEHTLTEAMIHVRKFREKGLNPSPVWSYAFGTNLTPWTNSYGIDPFAWEYPRQQPISLPHREGILTHPAWLIAHSQNSTTDPVRRGRWVREKLLAGRVPDLPITVDARIPEDPHKTLRERLDTVTSKQECWKCHQHMNPLGLSFEHYDDFGRYRTLESLEYPENVIAKATTKYGAETYKTKTVNATGSLSGTGDPALDGDVKDAMDMIGRLAKSERARQSIIRYAFRFYMGRNEMLSDSQTLIDADKAYLSSGGSFKAVIVSLLTSDSFIYRK